MTKLQRAVLGFVCVHYASTGQWYRATSSGERVTLASLCRKGALVRRAWRGHEGEANAAYEYRMSPDLVEAMSNV